ncbi:MAG: hypothetical protein ACI9CP_000787 [Cryomorphaceae bacterium]|jgi:hypothetical protein
MTLLSLSAQSPTHVDLGQGDGSIYVWDNPLYLIPIVAILVLLILFVWIKKKK